MMVNKKLKLSELDDDVKICREGDRTVYNVAQVKYEILNDYEDHYLFGGWHISEVRKWKPDAKNMIMDYLTHEYENGILYDGWLESAESCINDDVVGLINDILNNAFHKGGCANYYEKIKEVEIDIVPEIK